MQSYSPKAGDICIYSFKDDSDRYATILLLEKADYGQHTWHVYALGLNKSLGDINVNFSPHDAHIQHVMIIRKGEIHIEYGTRSSDE